MSKYRAVPTTVDGIRFASKREAKRYTELRMLEKAGAISRLELQPKFDIVIAGVPVKYPNGRTMRYTADFAYFEGQRRIVEDSKGFDNSRTSSRVLRVLAEHIYSMTVVLS